MTGGPIIILTAHNKIHSVSRLLYKTLRFGLGLKKFLKSFKVLYGRCNNINTVHVPLLAVLSTTTHAVLPDLLHDAPGHSCCSTLLHQWLQGTAATLQLTGQLDVNRGRRRRADRHRQLAWDGATAWKHGRHGRLLTHDLVVRVRGDQHKTGRITHPDARWTQTQSDAMSPREVRSKIYCAA